MRVVAALNSGPRSPDVGVAAAEGPFEAPRLAVVPPPVHAVRANAATAASAIRPARFALLDIERTPPLPVQVVPRTRAGGNPGVRGGVGGLVGGRGLDEFLLFGEVAGHQMPGGLGLQRRDLLPAHIRVAQRLGL